MGLAFKHLCQPPRFCFVKVATLVASVTASVFLLWTAATIIWKRMTKRQPETPIGRLVDSLVRYVENFVGTNDGKGARLGSKPLLPSPP